MWPLIKPHSASRLLIVPGLNDSAPAHWQTWLQSIHRDSVRVHQVDWGTPDLPAWSAQIGRTLDEQGPGHPWLVAAHSFGALALVHHLSERGGQGVEAALLVVPASPHKFGVHDLLPSSPLPLRSVVVASETDPWMPLGEAQAWAEMWGSKWVNLGDAGHINAESGHGPWPWAQRWVQGNQRRLERARRMERTSFFEWHFAL